MANGVRVLIVLLLAFLVSPVLSMAPATVPDDGSGPGGGAPVQGHQPSEGRSGQRAAGEPTRPDLVLNELNWSLAGMYDGAQGMLFATVFNDGAQVSAPFSVDMYVDGDPAGTAVVNGLAGGSFTTVKAPWTASSGDHELAARVDLTDQVAESNETNNLKIAYIDIAFPDLVISNVSWYPQDFREGDTVTFAITIANIGTGSTTRTFVLEAFMDQARLGNLIFAGLGSGNTALGTLQWSAKAGDHVLFLTLDSGGAVQEANELNNRYMAGLGQDFPDILLKDVSISPAELTDGAQAVLRATVENRGKGGTIQQFTVAFVMDGETIGSAGVFGLASNASNMVSIGWMAKAGHHDLRVFADYGSEVAESIESNNWKVISLDVPFPDLVVKDLRWEPTVPTDGRPVRLNITVSNIGEGPTARPFFVGVMADGVAIADLEVPGLRSGEERAVNGSWVASPGNHDLRAGVDATRAVPELDETNNVMVKGVDVPYPDIVVSNLNVSSSRPDPGAPVTLRALVRNAGPGNTSRYFEVKFYASGKEAGTVPFDGLSAGTQSNVTVSWNAEPGAFDVSVRADARDDIRELSELNNSAFLRIDAPYPDIAVTGMQWTPSNSTAGQQVDVSVRIRNLGPGNESAPFAVSLYANDTLMRSDQVPGLRAGENRTINFSFLLPSSPVRLRAAADVAGTVVELSETNNDLTMHYPNGTIAAPPPPPDVILSELRWFPQRPVDGDTVTFIASVKGANLTSSVPVNIDVLLMIDARKVAGHKVQLLAGDGLADFEWKAVPGPHSVMVMAETEHLVPELAEDNNWLFVSLDILPADIAVVSFQPSQPNSTDGEPAAVFCSLANLGPGDTRADVEISFFVDGELLQTTEQGGLPAGQTCSFVFSFTGSPGAHRLRAVVNQRGTLLETTPANDIAISALTVDRPDIVVSGIQMDARAEEGEQMVIAATVSNIGAGTVRDLQVAVFVDAVLIGRETVSGLLAGRSAPFTRQWTAGPGPHLVTVVADASGAVGEKNESNDWLSAEGMNVDQSDLQMRNIGVERPPVAGADCLVSAEVVNAGNATSRDITIGFFLDAMLARSVKLGGLPANASYVVSQTFPVGPGPHTLKASVDVLGSVLELDETNNDASLELDLSGSPELVLAGLKVPPEAVDGEEVRIFAEVQNGGLANFTDKFMVSLFVDGARLADCLVEGLFAGGSTTVSARWTASPGMHHFRAIVDQRSSIPESNETDNEMHKEGASTEQPDLYVAGVSADRGLGQPGTGAFMIFANVENIGGTTMRTFHVTALADSTPAGSAEVRGIPGRNVTQVCFQVHGMNPQRITVLVDPGDEIAEHNEFDNEASADFSPANELASMRPDLTVSDLTVSPPQPVDGQPATVFVQVANLGNGSMTAGVDVQLTAGGISTTQALRGLLPGGSAILGFPWTATGPITDLVATVDVLRTQAEWSEQNNVLERTVEVYLPDMRIVGLVHWNSTEGLGDPMFAVVENRGTGDSVRPSSLEMFIGGTLFAARSFNGLLSGEQLSFYIPRTAVSGDSDILLRVDPEGSTPESDEGNNQLTDTLYARYPELSIANVSWTHHVDNGSLLTIFAEVQNTGTGSTGRQVHVTFRVDSRNVDEGTLAGLPSGSTALLTWKWGLQPGSHTFSFMVDSTDSVWEPDENNDGIVLDYPSGEVVPRPAFLNLRLANLTFAQSRNQTGKDTENIVTLFISIENDGQVNLTGSSVAIMADSLLLVEVQVPPMPVQTNITVAFPWNATVANHTVKAVVDQRRQFREDIETDNDLTIFIEKNDPPFADAGQSYRVTEGDPVTFHGTGHDTDGYIALYEWDLNGDGRYEYGSNVSGTVQHAYSANGTYMVRLRITDDQGATAVASATIVVKLKQVKPLVRADEVTFAAVIISIAVLAAASVYIYRRRDQEGAV